MKGGGAMESPVPSLRTMEIDYERGELYGAIYGVIIWGNYTG